MCDYDLQPAIALFERYLILVKQKRPTEIHSMLGCEAYERLEQLQILLSRVTAIQHHVLSVSPLSGSFLLLPIEIPSTASNFVDSGIAIRDAFFHVRLYTESFYYLAFRFRQILTTPHNHLPKSYPLPLLDNFEVVGIRDVRNHLLEHPEGQTSRRFSQNHYFGGTNGPQLKIDSTTSTHTDKGLFVNAAELKQRLNASLTQAIATLESE